MEKKLQLVLYLVSFIEGAVLMANELLSSKILSVSFGTSIKSWAVLLSVTLFSLALGYYLGGILLKKSGNRFRPLILVLTGVFLFQLFFLPLAAFFTDLLLDFDLVPGSLLLCLFTIGPLLTGFGMISPFVIGIISDTANTEGGKAAGMVYGLSTIGGVIATFVFGLSVLPEYGNIMTSYTLAGLLAIPLVLVGLSRKSLL